MIDLDLLRRAAADETGRPVELTSSCVLQIIAELEAGRAPSAHLVPTVTLPSGQRMIDGEKYYVNGDGGLIPDAAVKVVDKLQDEIVRKIIEAALPISAIVSDFRLQTLSDVDDFVLLLEQEYGARRGGAKGNLTFTSFDGTLKITVQVSENVSFGPELQVAKGLVDECLREWSVGTRTEIKAIINRAFDVDNQGRINRNDLLGLLRLEIEDSRWQDAMRAIRDSMRVVGSKRYVRMYRRPDVQAGWVPITIDVASGEARRAGRSTSVKPFDQMQLGNLAMVNRIADARGALLHRISVVEAGRHETLIPSTPPFCITIDGARMGEDLLAVVRPVLVRELKAQVAQLERDLLALGVRVG
jgi:hypothetical protein